MNAKKFTKLMTILIAGSVAFSSYAQNNTVDEIEIKNISLKKTKEEILENTEDFERTSYGNVHVKNSFTVAGIKVTSPYVVFSRETEKMYSFTFSFKPSEFGILQAAIKAKYPAMTCKDSEIGNKAGAKFLQTECELKEPLGVMKISKYSTSVTSGSFELNSHEKTEYLRQELQKKLKDL